MISRRALLGAAGGALLAGCTSTRPLRPARGSGSAAPGSVGTAAILEPVEKAVLYDAHGGLFIDAALEGRAARFLLDTGASRSALARSAALELGLALGEGGTVEGTAGTVEVGSAVARVAVAPLAELEVDFTVYDFGSYDPLCVGILGYELLHLAPFQIRYRSRTLVWNATMPPGALALRLENRIPRVTAELNGASVDLRIDTGAALAPSEESYFNLTQAQAALAGLTGDPAMVFSATGTGGAALELPVFALREARVGDREIPKAFAIVQPKVGYFARDDAVGFLGNSVLEKLDPVIDYGRGAFGIGA